MEVVVTTKVRNPSTNSTCLQIDGVWLVDSIKTVDWSDSSDRKWLMNHMHWAMNNDKSVQLTPDRESN